jgi:hypothetical protein
VISERERERDFPLKREQGPEKSEPDQKEWDFREIPKTEVEACFIYEYARELARRSPRIFDLLAKWQAGWSTSKRSVKKAEGRKAGMELTKTLNACFADFPSAILDDDRFPDTPWQALDEKVRSTSVEDLNQGLRHYWNSLPFDKLSIQTVRQLEEANVTNMEAFRWVHELFRTKEDLSQSEYGFFAIHWGYPDPAIKRAFGIWLSEQRQDREKRGLTEIKYRPRGRGSLRDQLNWLGALRVKEHYPREQLVDYPRPRLKVAARPYENLPDLYEGASKAPELLDRLLQLAGRS